MGLGGIQGDVIGQRNVQRGSGKKGGCFSKGYICFKTNCIMSTKARLLIAAVVGLCIGLFFYFKPAPDRSVEAASQRVEAEVLYVAMSEGESAAYLNKVINVSGVVKGVDGQTLVLRPGIACRMEGDFDTPRAGETVSVKGRVLGFDDMFGEVQLDFAVLD